MPVSRGLFTTSFGCSRCRPSLGRFFVRRKECWTTQLHQMIHSVRALCRYGFAWPGWPPLVSGIIREVCVRPTGPQINIAERTVVPKGLYKAVPLVLMWSTYVRAPACFVLACPVAETHTREIEDCIGDGAERKRQRGRETDGREACCHLSRARGSLKNQPEVPCSTCRVTHRGENRRQPCQRPERGTYSVSNRVCMCPTSKAVSLPALKASKSPILLTFPSLGLFPAAPPPPLAPPGHPHDAPPAAPPLWAPLIAPPPLSVLRLSSSRVKGLSSSSWSESSPELKSSQAGGWTLRRSGTVVSAAPPSRGDVNPWRAW